MANSILQDIQGPDWPLGFIAVVTPGTPVRLTSLVDPSAINAPEAATSTTSAEYTPRLQQLIFSGFKPNGSTGQQANAGNVYLVRYNAANNGGAGNRNDPGVMVKVIQPGETFFLSSAPANRNVYSPYRYAVDADNSGDGLLIVGIVQ